MSAESVDTQNGIWQFIEAYEANYVTRDGKLVIDDPEVRHRLIRAMDSYTRFTARAAPRPSAVDGRPGQQQAFLAQTIVMTPNPTLSIPNALKTERPEDYYKNAVTIEWPDGADGQPLAIETALLLRHSLQGRRACRGRQGVRPLPGGEGWLAHYLDFSNDRLLPPMPKLLDAPFWLDPSDPHRMRCGDAVPDPPACQRLAAASRDWRYLLPDREQVWAKAVHRVAAEGISPEQAVDEAIARIKQILSE